MGRGRNCFSQAGKCPRRRRYRRWRRLVVVVVGPVSQSESKQNKKSAFVTIMPFNMFKHAERGWLVRSFPLIERRRRDRKTNT